MRKKIVSFDLHDLLSASGEVLGKGGYGTAYKVDLKDGTTVMVKRFKKVVVSSKREFEQQMEIIEKVGRLPNVVRLRAYYYTKDEQFLVYDYIPARSLYFLLHEVARMIADLRKSDSENMHSSEEKSKDSNVTPHPQEET